MLQPCKLDLEFAFGTAGTLTEDLEDELGPIKHPHLPCTLQIALLDGGNFMIEQNKVDPERLDGLSDLVDLASTKIEPRIRTWSMCNQSGPFRMPGRCGQRRKLVERGVIATFAANRHTKQQCGRAFVRGRGRISPPGWRPGMVGVRGSQRGMESLGGLQSCAPSS